MFSYYKKISVWTVLNVTSTTLFMYILGQRTTSQIALIAMTQGVMTLTVYSPFEFYWSWTTSHPCVCDE